MCSACSIKSNSMSRASWPASLPQAMADVLNPRAVTYSGTFHQWFCSGVSASRVLPTICVHMCRVSAVSDQWLHSSSGHAASLIEPPLCLRRAYITANSSRGLADAFHLRAALHDFLFDTSNPHRLASAPVHPQPVCTPGQLYGGFAPCQPYPVAACRAHAKKIHEKKEGGSAP